MSVGKTHSDYNMLGASYKLNLCTKLDRHRGSGVTPLSRVVGILVPKGTYEVRALKLCSSLRVIDAN